MCTSPKSLTILRSDCLQSTYLITASYSLCLNSVVNFAQVDYDYESFLYSLGLAVIVESTMGKYMSYKRMKEIIINDNKVYRRVIISGLVWFLF